MAAMTTSGEALMLSMAAPVPRPPQPMTPTRMRSEAPAANTPPGIAAASEASEAVLMTSRRVMPGCSEVVLSFIAFLFSPGRRFFV